jgi:hypothetical protein
MWEVVLVEEGVAGQENKGKRRRKEMRKKKMEIRKEGT